MRATRERMPVSSVKIDGNKAVVSMQIYGIKHRSVWVSTTTGFKSNGNTEKFWKRIKDFGDEAEADDVCECFQALESAACDMLKTLREGAYNIGIDVCEDVKA